MATLRRTSAADQDVRNIAYQIGVESGRPLTAEKVVGELIAAFHRLAELSPKARLGTRTPQLGKDVRLFSVSRWVVIYRYMDDGVLILRVADGSQDYLSWKLDPD